MEMAQFQKFINNRLLQTWIHQSAIAKGQSIADV